MSSKAQSLERNCRRTASRVASASARYTYTQSISSIPARTVGCFRAGRTRSEAVFIGKKKQLVVCSSIKGSWDLSYPYHVE